jgi:hypothetical protein
MGRVGHTLHRLETFTFIENGSSIKAENGSSIIAENGSSPKNEINGSGDVHQVRNNLLNFNILMKTRHFIYVFVFCSSTLKK